jgi:hypothetical protein
MTTALIVIFALWFAATIANQVPALRRRFAGTLNSFGVLPSLGLFAPEPRDVDYHVVYRDADADGAYTAWRELAFDPGGPLRALWNPGGRDCGAMIHIVASLSILGGAVAPSCRTGDHVVLVSLPYLVLLHAVLAEPRSPGAVARQFAVVETTGFGADRALSLGISSPLHPLDPRA